MSADVSQQGAVGPTSTRVGDAIDIGNLGASIHSYPIINNAGDVAGTMTLVDNTYHAVRWRQATDMLEDFGTPWECRYTTTEGINASGVVAGFASGCPASAQFAFVATPGEPIRQLVTPFLYPAIRAYAINDAGTVAGTDSRGDILRWDAAGAATSAAYAPSTNGIVVGRGSFGKMFITPTGTISGQLSGTASNGMSRMVGFIWVPGDFVRELGSLGGYGTDVTAMNKDAVVVGRSSTALFSQRAFRWSTTTGMQDLGTLGGTMSWARAINDAGEIVGHAATAGNQSQRAFRWTAATGMVELPLPAGSSDAYGINGRGVITGVLCPTAAGAGCAGQRGFRWSAAQGYEDLGTLGGRTSLGSAINDASQVAGFWTTATGAPRYARWDPTNHAPVAALDGPYSGSEGIAVAFSAAASTDVDGDALSYTWDFGDGTPTDTTSTPTTTHTFRDNHPVATPYSVSVIVTDSRGASDVARSTATIANAAPVAAAGPDVALTVGLPYTLPGSFTDAGLGDGPWSYSVNWGDGTAPATGTVASQSDAIAPTHAWAALGSYTATLTVTDTDGAIGTDQVAITIGTNSSPVARMTGPTSGLTGQVLGFSAVSSTDPDGDALTFNWSMGDGAVRSGATVDYAYNTSGTFTVVVTATDPFGAVSTASLRVRVSVNTLPRVVVTAGPPQLAGALASLSGAVTDPDFGSGGLLNVEILWGDGTSTRTTTAIAGGKGNTSPTFSASHVYPSTPARFFTPEVRVTDAYGATGSGTTRLAAAAPVRAVRTTATEFQAPDGTPYVVRNAVYYIVFSSSPSGVLDVINLAAGSVTIGDNADYEAPAKCGPLRDADGDGLSDALCSVTPANFAKARPNGGVVYLNGTLNGGGYSNVPIQGRQ